ncbi:MAG: conjugal transfer protein TraD [Alphaproteobacteria bacterium]|nr:conjugal transfer protein TraD [Alphaproteobacteria bacterium]
MATLEVDSRGLRRARTRSLIQLAGLMEKAKLLETFDIELGRDMQKDPKMKEPIAALFKGLLVLNEMAASSEVNLSLWATQGLEELRRSNRE